MYVIFIVIITACPYIYYQLNRKEISNNNLRIVTDRTDEETSEAREEYYKNINNLNRLTEKNIEWRNKFILTISSALFGLLFTNFKYPLSGGIIFYILVINNGLTLIGTLLSYSFAILGINKKKFFSLRYYIYDEFEYRNKETLYGKIADYLNLLSITTTCLTIVYLVIILILK